MTLLVEKVFFLHFDGFLTFCFHLFVHQPQQQPATLVLVLPGDRETDRWSARGLAFPVRVQLEPNSEIISNWSERYISQRTTDTGDPSIITNLKHGLKPKTLGKSTCPFSDSDPELYFTPTAELELQLFSEWNPQETSRWSGDQGEHKDGQERGRQSKCQSWGYYYIWRGVGGGTRRKQGERTTDGSGWWLWGWNSRGGSEQLSNVLFPPTRSVASNSPSKWLYFLSLALFFPGCWPLRPGHFLPCCFRCSSIHSSASFRPPSFLLPGLCGGCYGGSPHMWRLRQDVFMHLHAKAPRHCAHTRTPIWVSLLLPKLHSVGWLVPTRTQSSWRHPTSETQQTGHWAIVGTRTTTQLTRNYIFVFLHITITIGAVIYCWEQLYVGQKSKWQITRKYWHDLKGVGVIYIQVLILKGKKHFIPSEKKRGGSSSSWLAPLISKNLILESSLFFSVTKKLFSWDGLCCFVFNVNSCFDVPLQSDHYLNGS